MAAADIEVHVSVRTRKAPDGAWEVVTDEDCELTERLKVPGGWLYRTALFEEDEDGEEDARTGGVALCFVAMPNGYLLDEIEPDEDAPVPVDSVGVAS